MTGDHSLDDFLDAGGSEDAAEPKDDPNEPNDTDEPDTDTPSASDSEPAPGTEADPEPDDEQHPTDPDSVDPAEPTYDWSPDGADCAACDESVTTRWRQDGEYVCADCKDW